MVIFKITLNLSGINFFPSKILDKIELDCLVIDSNEHGDKIGPEQGLVFEFGSMSILNPSVFGLQYDEWEYEEWYVQFIEKNHDLFKLNGIEDIQFLIDVFYSGDQCNIEVFNKKMLQRLNKYISFSLPLSVYRLKRREIKEMLLETGFTKDNIKEKG